MSLNIPYPQRYLLEQELKHHAAYASAEGAHGPQLSERDLAELATIHSTRLHRLLQICGTHRKAVETALAFVPLVAGLCFTLKEEIMVDFIREGGIGMYAILALGGFLFGREALNILRLIMVKDHSPENLRIDTVSVLLGCLALMLMSVGSTVLGLYFSAGAVAQSHLSYDLLVIGAKESLTNLVLSSFLSALVVLAHYGTRRTLHVWHAVP